jgi:hypothetical protein
VVQYNEKKKGKKNFISDVSIFSGHLKRLLFVCLFVLQLFVSAQLLLQWFSLSLSIYLFDGLIHMSVFALKSEW